MIFIAAFLFAVSLAFIGWTLSQREAELEVLGARARRVFDSSLGTAVDAKLKGLQSHQKTLLSYEECEKNPIKLALFLAGIRKRSFLKLAETAFIMLAVFPFLSSLVLLMMDQFSWQIVMRMVAAAGAAVFLFFILIKQMAARRQRSIMRDLPEFFDLVVVCMEAGLNFTAALPRVMKELEPKSILVQEFNILHNEFLGGISLPVACARTIKRCNVSDVTRSLNAIIQSEKLGTGLGRTFRVHAQEVRDKLRQRIRERAHRIPVKIVFPMMLMLFGGLFFMLGGSVYFRLLGAMNAIGLT